MAEKHVLQEGCWIESARTHRIRHAQCSVSVLRSLRIYYVHHVRVAGSIRLRVDTHRRTEQDRSEEKFYR